MSIFCLIESKIHTFRWYDFSLIKLASFSFALLIAKLWPALLLLDWPVYLIIALVAAAPVCLKLLRKE